MKIIGMLGNAGSGKDTFATMLLAANNHVGFTESFGATLREMICVFLDVDQHRLDELKRDPSSVARKALQTLGTEWGRNIMGWNVWVDALAGRIKNRRQILDDFIAAEGIIVVTDLRFQNEVDWVLVNGGSLIHIKRKSAEESPLISTHASETAITSLSEQCHYHVNNNGTLYDLAADASEMLKDILETK